MTEKTYQVKLSHLEKIQPNHPLLARLKGGFSAINSLYLQKIYATLDLDLLVLSDTEGVNYVQNTEGVIEAATDEIFRSMLKKKYHLRNALRATKNKFHDCRDDAQRRAVSIEVNTLFDTLRGLQEEINHYERFGRLPISLEREESDSFFEVPDTEGEVLKAINTCDSTISQIHKDIKNFDFTIKNDPTHVQYKSWQRLEKRLNKWQNKRKGLLNERERYKRLKHANT